MSVARRLEAAAANLQAGASQPWDAEASATAFLGLACLAATAWSAVRLLAGTGAPDYEQALAAYWLSGLDAGARSLQDEILAGAHALDAAWSRRPE